MEYQRLWAAMHERLGYERQGPGLMALSAVDMALWDLRGRALGQPICRLLGGPIRTRVPAYASGPYLRPGRDPYRAYRREAERIIAPGFRAMKMKVGVDPGRGRARRERGAEGGRAGRDPARRREPGLHGPARHRGRPSARGRGVRLAGGAGRPGRRRGVRARGRRPRARRRRRRGARRDPRLPVLLRAERPRRRAARPRDRRGLHRGDARRGPRRGVGGARRAARLGHGAEPLRVAPALRRAARLPEPHADAVSRGSSTTSRRTRSGSSGARRRSARTAWWRFRRVPGSASRSTRRRSSRICCAAARSAATETDLRPVAGRQAYGTPRAVAWFSASISMLPPPCSPRRPCG